MELSPEEKQRIYDEEKARNEAQEKLKKEQQQKKAKNVGIGCLTFIVIIIVLSVIGATSSNKSTNSDTSSSSSVSDNVSKPDLETSNVSSEADEYCWYVTGTVTNNSSTKTYSYVQVEINLYDNSGAQVGSTLANTNNLEPNGRWKFKAIVTEQNAKKYKVKDVTGY